MADLAENRDNDGSESIDFIRRVAEGGKITIPKELRDLHQIEDGTYLRLKIVAVLPKARDRERGARP